MKLVIVDDEPLARERLRRMLAAFPGWEVVAEAAHGEQALQRIRATEPDLVLLDIHMPGMDGLQVARALADERLPPAVVFVTAYTEHALSAHETHAAGYLLKPIRRAQLAQALQRARRPSRAQLRALTGLADADETGRRRFIHANTRDGMIRIPLPEVVYFLADQKYTAVHHLQGEALIEESLRSLEADLDDSFLRVHRKALVAKRFIAGLGRDKGMPCLKMQHSGARLPVSRRRLPEVRRLLMRDR